MKKRKIIEICAVIFSVCFLHISSEMILIPEHFPNIQEGINQAADGDTVLVSSGIYYENLNFLGKEILLTSHFLFEEDPSYIAETIIDGSNAANPDSTSTLIFCNNETESTIIQGFTIRSGGGSSWIDPQYPSNAWLSGGGIFMYYASPTIRFNHIKENIVENDGSYDGASGGGLLCFRGNPTITNNIFSLNQADYGAGIVVDYSGAIIKNNLVIENSGGQLYGGGGFYFIGNDVEPIIVENNTIFGNHSETNGGAMRMWGSTITSLNNIIWGNTQNSGGQIYGVGSSSFTFCDIEGGLAGMGNIDLNPQFIDEELFLLDENSPCIDAGNPNMQYNDLEDENNPGFAQFPSMGTFINDMGVYGGSFASCFQQTDSEINTVQKPIIKLSNYPNPFNPTTTIEFSIVKISSRVLGQNPTRDFNNPKIDIYNLKGQKVKTFPNLQINKSPNQQIIWNGKDQSGKPVSSGIYFYSLKINLESTITKQMLLVK
ncbi:MAG: hypothetical protein K8S23_13360 [Candidatus Cloacimonetes bacterium]|nr:hypothetical protein [Candidatus Cloacimonadota bacterium]